jgi:hypothetical protein
MLDFTTPLYFYRGFYSSGDATELLNKGVVPRGK